MGTLVEITVPAAPSGTADAVDRAFAEMRRVEELMRPDGPGSEAAAITAAEGPIEVGSETAEVIALGMKVARLSGGGFDMGLGRLKTLWGIETEHPRVPKPEEILSALEGTGPEDLMTDGNRVLKSDPRLAVDLGAIAKGFAIDRAAEILRNSGVTRAVVNAGGDLCVIGDRGDRPWRIGIQHPRDPGALLATLSLENVSVVTSGDYERFFEAQGQRYHHLFDPRTGYPAGLAQSMTVVAPSAALADALATAAFVLGPEQGLALLKEFSQVEGLLVAADGTIFISEGLREKVEWP